MPPPMIVALYRAVVSLSPEPFRTHFAGEQVALFAEIWRDERPRGLLATGTWLLALFARACLAAVALHFDKRRRRTSSPRNTVRGIGPDWRYAVRSLWRSPWYAVTLTVVIAVGIALEATVFAFVDGVLFKPLPYRASHELFSLQGRAGGDAVAGSSVSLRDVRSWREAVPEASFTVHSTSIGYGTLGVINGPTVWSRGVDRDFWETVGVQPRFGRFEPADYDAELATRPVVITHGLWQRLFGADPGAVGRIIQAGRLTLRIAGVLPAEFVFPTGAGQVKPDMLFPATHRLDADSANDSRSYDVIARIPAELPLEAVRARLDAATHGVQRVAPQTSARQRPFDAVEIVSLKRIITADARPVALLVFTAMAVMLLLVAINVGGLVGSRSLDRLRESAARRALGASSFALARLQLLEVGTLVIAGATLGVLIARLLVAETARRLPADVVFLREPSIDGRVIAAVIGAATVIAMAAILAGVRASHRASLTSLLGQGAGAAVVRTRSLGRMTLQAGQVALAMLLVLGGTLFTASLRNVWRVDTGYDLSNTLYIDARVSSVSGGPTAPDRVLALLPILRAIPGVSSAGVMDTILLSGARRGSSLQAPQSAARDDAELIPISSGVFHLAGLRPIDGRLPTDEEIDAGAPLAVVSERVARDYWPGQSAIGQVLTGRRASVTIVGVVKDARFQRLDQPSFGEIYVPMVLGFWTSSAPTFLVRSPLPESAVMPALLEALKRFDPAVSIRRAQPVASALAESIKRRRFHAWLFGLMAAASLLVAGAGIFGLVATSTARRTREVGVRLALGSTHRQLVRLLLREQLAPVLAGVVVGGAVAAWAVIYVRSLLYELSAYDVRVWAIAGLTVVAVAVSGTLVPAWRLKRVDPVTALRTE